MLAVDESIWEEQWQRISRYEDSLLSLDAFGRRALHSFGCWISGDDQMILEAGSGTGRFALAIAKRYPSSQVIGLDISFSAVSLARRIASRTGIDNGHFKVGNIFEMPFVDGSFDVTFNEGVVEHFVDFRDAISEMIRVAKPGGKVIVAVPNWYCLPHTLYKRFKGDRYQYGYEKSFKSKELIAIFRDFGLVDIEVSGFDPAYGIGRMRKLSRLGPMLDKLVIKPLDALTRSMFSKKFGFEICVKGVKPPMEAGRCARMEGTPYVQS